MNRGIALLVCAVVGGGYGWSGTDSSLRAHVHGTIVNLLGFGLDDVQHRQLATYLLTMRAPNRTAHLRTKQEERGEAIYHSTTAGCAGCHVDGPSMVFDVKSAVKRDAAPTFLAPSLRFIAGTAPYFHDGRYATLEQLIRESDGTMAPTKDLTDDDVAALAAYLRTL